jgi:Tfp pilus assembly protein PilN
VLRTNLSTRPFYNERAAHIAIGGAAAIVVALTTWNVVRIVSLSRHNTELATRIGKEKIETENLNHQAAEIRRTINKDELANIAVAAQEANSLIDQRTFSWTEFFNRIESTLPPDVMLTSVRPSFKNGETNVTMLVLGRRAEDVDEFMEKLEATGAFEDVLPGQGDRTEEGLIRQVIESKYHPVEEEEKPAPVEAIPPPAQPAPPAGQPPVATPQPPAGAATKEGRRGGRL